MVTPASGKTPPPHGMPAEKAMKQFSKTAAERDTRGEPTRAAVDHTPNPENVSRSEPRHSGEGDGDGDRSPAGAPPSMP